MQAQRGGTKSNSALTSWSSQSDGEADPGTDYDNTRWQIQEQRWVTMEAQRRRSQERKCLRTELGLRERVED